MYQVQIKVFFLPAYPNDIKVFLAFVSYYCHC
jgi:hypothetical protein